MVQVVLASVRLLLVSAGLLSLAVGEALAAGQRSCRQCSCDVSLQGSVGRGTENDVDTLMRAGADIFTGGDRYQWTTRPSTPCYNGKAHINRLCGNGRQASGIWNVQAFSGAASKITLSNCECPQSVKCRGGSHCEDSGL